MRGITIVSFALGCSNLCDKQPLNGIQYFIDRFGVFCPLEAVNVRATHWYPFYRHTVFQMIQSCITDDYAEGPRMVIVLQIWAQRQYLEP